MKLVALLIIGVLAISFSTVLGSDVEKTFRNLAVSVPKFAGKSPTIDGTVDPAEWAGAGMAPRMVLFERDDRLTDNECKFYYAYDDDAFYMAFQVARPKGATEPRATITERDKSFWQTDDALEFMINANPESKERRSGRDYYFIFNAINTQYDRREDPNDVQNANLRWNPEWQLKCRVVPEYGWEGEARFPFKTCLDKVEMPAPGVIWHFQLADNQATPFPRVALLGFQWEWFLARDYPNFVFTGDQGVYARVLDSGAMVKDGKGGVKLEVVNPSQQPRTVQATLKLYQRKQNPPNPQSYLRAFDQSRDRPEDIKGTGKVALFIADDKLSENILTENFDLLQDKSGPVELAAGERKQLELAIAAKPGDYIAFYDIRYPDGKKPDDKHHTVVAGNVLPFAIPEPLDMTFANFFLKAKLVDVDADLRYVPGWEGKGTVTSKLVASSAPDKALFEKSWSEPPFPPILEYPIPVKDLAPGEYKVMMSVKDPAGKLLQERAEVVTIPQTPDWFTKPVGAEPTIPTPWKPIEASGPKVSLLMGEYVMGANSVLPEQINLSSVYEKERKPILRAPMTLTGVVDGQPVKFEGAPQAGQQKPEIVQYTSKSNAGGVDVSSKIETEFDGLSKVTLTISPEAGKTPKLTDLTLSIPVTKEISTLYRRGRFRAQEKVKTTNGLLPKEGWKHDWSPSVWIGNETRGLEWFAENERGWRVSNALAGEAIEVAPSDDGATLRIHFVRMADDKPLVLDKPREIVFGYIFTPTRPFNPTAIRHGLGLYDNEWAHKLDDEVAASVNAIETWNHNDHQGWMEETPEMTARYAKATKNLHAKGIKVTPYSGWGISRKAAVYPMFGGEMVVEPMIDIGCGCDAICWNSPVGDAYLDKMKTASLASGYDGFRMDAGFAVWGCMSTKHVNGPNGETCGWKNDNGQIQPSVSLFGAREAAKRAYRMFHGGEISKDGLCLHHIHGSNRFTPILSFIDGVVSAEGAERTALNIKEFPLDYWRAVIMEDARGLQVIYGPKSDTLGNDSRLGVGALHNLTVRGGSLVSLKEQSYSRSGKATASIWKAEDWVQWLDPGTKFIGYWANEKLLQTGNEWIKGSLHVRPGEKILLALLNLERQPMKTTVKLDLPALGFTSQAYAIDAVLNEPIEIKDGAMELTFTAESYRLIKIAAQPFPIVTPKKIGENMIPELDAAKWPAQGLPAKWSGPSTGFAVVDGAIVATGNGQEGVQISRAIPIEVGKHYMLEMEVLPRPTDGVYFGSRVDVDHFGATFGEFYGAPRTIGSALLPGQTEIWRCFYTGVPTKGGEPPKASLRIYARGDGSTVIKSIAVYEVDARK